MYVYVSLDIKVSHNRRRGFDPRNSYAECR